MKQQNAVAALITKGVKFYNDHQREILLGLAIGGAFVTGVISWRNGMKCERVLQEQGRKMEDVERNHEDGEYESEAQYEQARKEVTKETVKKVAVLAAGPVVAYGSTVLATVGGYKCASGQMATLAALYKASEEASSEIAKKAEEIAGPKKGQQIKDDANIEQMKKAYEKGDAEIVETGKGNVLFYDKYCGRFFRSSWESIRAAVNNINRDWNDGMYDDEVSYNELAAEFGLEQDSVFGDAFVFRKDDRFNYGSNIDLMTSTGQLECKMMPGTMESATVIDYHVKPVLARRYTKGY